jgi:predicted acetyltransferase
VISFKQLNQITVHWHCEESEKYYAGIAQLVERNLAKVEVASSNLVSRSKLQGKLHASPFSLYWRNGRVVMLRTANPPTSVRFRVAPPKIT